MNKEIMKPTITLLGICLVVSLMLALTYIATKDKIDLRAAEQNKVIQKEVLPTANKFELIKLNSVKKYVSTEEFSLLKNIYKATNSNKDIGYVISLATPGYGGEINIIVGVSNNGKIEGVKMGENRETPGLGTKAAEKPFLSQLSGFIPNKPLEVIKSKKTRPEEIEAISGATITSKAVVRAVQLATEVTKKINK